MKKLLVLQFRKFPQNIEKEIKVYTRAFQTLPVTITFKNVFHDQLDWNYPERICKDADGVILGGSGDLYFDGGLEDNDEAVLMSQNFAQLQLPLFAYLKKREIPTLGICFGHQILAYTQGIQVHNDALQAKLGSHEVVLTEEGRHDPLFQGIPSQFTAQYGHRDSLSALPEGAVLLAFGEQCLYSAVRYAQHQYSLQFHPELTEEDMRLQYVTNKSHLLPRSDTEIVIRDSHHALKIFHNFVFLIMGADAVDQFRAEGEKMHEASFTTR